MLRIMHHAKRARMQFSLLEKASDNTVTENNANGQYVQKMQECSSLV